MNDAIVSSEVKYSAIQIRTMEKPKKTENHAKFGLSLINEFTS